MIYIGLELHAGLAISEESTSIPHLRQIVLEEPYADGLGYPTTIGL